MEQTDESDREWAIRGWYELFQTIEGEWGPYGIDHFVANQMSGAPAWLIEGVRKSSEAFDDLLAVEP